MIEELYYREIKVPFNILRITKKEIPTRIETPLNFYQKYVILLLKNGIEAPSIKDLIIKISEMLNIKLEIIKEFVDELNNLNAINHKKNIYVLSENTNYYPSEKNNRIFVSNIKEGKDRINYIYFTEIGALTTQNLLDKNNIPTGEFINTTIENQSLINKILEKNEIAVEVAEKSLGRVLIDKKVFEEEDFKADGVISKSTIHLPIRVAYKYDREEQRGKYVDCELNIEDNTLDKYLDSKTISTKIKTAYAYDNKKPDYILYEEYLDKKRKQVEEIETLETEINSNATELEIISQKREDLIKKQTTENPKQNKENVSSELVVITNKKREILQTNIEKNKKIEKIKQEIETEKLNTITDKYEKSVMELETLLEQKEGNFLNVKENVINIQETFMKLYKKINSDALVLHEIFSMYEYYTHFLKSIVCYILNCDYDSINSISQALRQNDLSINFRHDFMLKISLTGQVVDKLIIAESIIDHVRHLFDSKENQKRFKENNPNKYNRDLENFEYYKKLSKEDKKALFNPIITVLKNSLIKIKNIEDFEKYYTDKLERLK